MQRPVRADYSVRLVQTLPLPSDGAVPAPVVRPLDVERSRNHLVLENLTIDEFTAATIRGATRISIDSIPEGLAEDVRRRAVGAYRITDEDARVVCQRRVREPETGLVASINLVDLTTVMHADGRYRGRAAYSIRNFTLQFLEMEPPRESQVWSVHVSGEPVRPAKARRQGRVITLLPPRKISAGDFSSKVVMVYSGRLEEPLGRWTRPRLPAPRILSDVPVPRTLWTVFLPREYRVSLAGDESNLEKVAASYQQEERKLSFLDELRQMTRVAGKKGKSGAARKAQYNLKQLGSALQEYAGQNARVDAKIAADVQEQARQIETEIKRLEEIKTGTLSSGEDASRYFKPPTAESERAKVLAGLKQDFETLAEERAAADDEKTEPKEPRKGAEKDAEKDAGQGRREAAGGRPEQQRGRLREQAAEQLDRLQSLQEKGRGQQEIDSPQRPAKSLQSQEEAAAVDTVLDTERQTKAEPQQGGKAVRAAPAAGTGSPSLDLHLDLKGSPYHFRKLHGQPRLVPNARHEDLDRLLIAMVWAGLCLVLATAVIYGLRRTDAALLAYRGWPWLAAVAGTACYSCYPRAYSGWPCWLPRYGCSWVARKPGSSALSVSSLPCPGNLG